MAAIDERMHKILVVILVVVAFGLGAFGLTHWLVYRSAAYAAAASYLGASPELAAIVGQVRAVTLSWFEHTSVEELEVDGRPSGNAEFTVLVEGTSGSLPVPIRLSRGEQGWRVTSAVAGNKVLKSDKAEIATPKSTP